MMRMSILYNDPATGANLILGLVLCRAAINENRYSPSKLKGKVYTLSYFCPMVTLTSPVLIP